MRGISRGSASGEAWQAIDGLIEAKDKPPELFREFRGRLTTNYPCICTLSDDDVDDGVGATGLCGMTSAIALRVGRGLSTSGGGSAVKTANDLGLAVFRLGRTDYLSSVTAKYHQRERYAPSIRNFCDNATRQALVVRHSDKNSESRGIRVHA